MSTRKSQRQVSTPTATVQTDCMQIKEAALRVSREQGCYNNSNSVGSPQKHACYC